MLVNLTLENKRVLVVGGGNVALRKIKKLQKYNCKVTLVSPNCIEEIRGLNVEIIESKFCYNYLVDIDIVFLCTNNSNLHEEIIEFSKNKKIIINNSTSQTNMDFSMVSSFIFDEYEIAVTSKKGIKENKLLRDSLQSILENKKFR
ncbi:MAG: bifunctional precorrin-2 dehydrogenase/sirohydrochlorin ferrochelatase [Bacilli bacterium]